ncbi:hypothetical protein LWC05_01930 [Acetobacter sicerae]|uniref:Uncharacterized protein n=1 Tax=Acetobacter sicerae TaxID=85325 RepID=A0ABS8VUT5_9PROT|nr:hypothetical protein [Acetobacter sicerae]MCE0742657.1 hypothetical protein [Acetobacter sicerae]NHN90706.1 hypothetical protein [Acetobacter sicerae]
MRRIVLIAAGAAAVVICGGILSLGLSSGPPASQQMVHKELSVASLTAVPQSPPISVVPPQTVVPTAAPAPAPAATPSVAPPAAPAAPAP